MELSNLWIIKDALDQVQGPFDTTEILIQIKNGVISGDEKIASYPEGAWKEISAEPEFFDYMLSVLTGEDVSIPKSNNKGFDKDGAEEPRTEQIDFTVPVTSENGIQDLLSDAEPIFPDDKLKSGSREENFLENLDSQNDLGEIEDDSSSPQSLVPAIQHREVKGRSHLFEDRQSHSIDELKRLNEKSEKDRKSKIFLYLLAVVASGLVLSFLFVEDGGAPKKNQFMFVLPEKSKNTIESADQKNQKLKQAVGLIKTDLTRNVMSAQMLLNSVLSYEPRNKTSLLFLCNSYLRLWDFTGKTGADLYVVSEISKRAYGIGSDGDVLYSCRLVEMILRGKISEAEIAVDAFLNAEGLSGQVSFYLRYFKGYLLAQKKEYTFAASFLESSVKIEPQWIPSLLLLGDVYKKLNRSQESYNLFARVLQISPQHPEAHFHLAMLNIEVFGKVNNGLNIFKKAVSLSEGKLVDKKIQSRAYSTVAKVYLKNRRKSKAEEYAKTAFELDSSNISAKNILISTGAKADASSADKYVMAEAEALFNAREWKAAAAVYEQAYSINPKNGLAALRISECYWRQSFVKDAIKWGELAVAANPKRIESYISLSNFLINQFRFVDAARVLMKARAINKSSYEVYRGFARIAYLRKNYQGAVKYAGQALTIYSNDVESILLLVKAYKSMDEIEKAYANARAAMEVSRSSFELENIYVELLMKTQGFPAAMEYIDGRMNASAGDLKYQIMLANMYFEDQQFEEAANISSRANEMLEGEMYEGLLVYAKAMGALGQLGVALDFYQRAFLLKPTQVDPLFYSGVMLLENKKPKLAMEQFERVQRANQNYPDLQYQWAVAKKKVAVKERSKEMAIEAIDLCKKELAKNTAHYQSHLLIAESYYILGDITRAKTQKIGQEEEAYSDSYSEMVSWYKLCAKSYQKAIDITGGLGGDVFIDMAKCYRLSGALDQATASAVRAEELDKTNPRIWMEIGQIYEQQGNSRASLKAYENFLLVYPNAPNKKEVENRINRLKSMIEEN